MKSLFKNWLEKLAKANEKSFGSGPLDCCQLNKDNKTRSGNSIKPINVKEGENKTLSNNTKNQAK